MTENIRENFKRYIILTDCSYSVVNKDTSQGDFTSDQTRRSLLKTVGSTTALAGLATATASGAGDREPTQLSANAKTAFGRLFEALPLLEKLSEEGFLPEASTAAFPVTELETEFDGGVGRFQTNSYFGEQHVFVTHLDNAEVQVIVSERGAPSAMIDPVGTDDQRVVSLSEDPGDDDLAPGHYDVDTARLACDDCWCDGCCCCCLLKDLEKVYCRNYYDGECITTNKCNC